MIGFHTEGVLSSLLPSVPPRYGPALPLTAFPGGTSLTTQDPPLSGLSPSLNPSHSTMIYDQVTGWCSMVVTAERFGGWWIGQANARQWWWRSECWWVTKAEVGAAAPPTDIYLPASAPPAPACLVPPPVPTCPSDTCTTAAGPAPGCDSWCNFGEIC